MFVLSYRDDFNKMVGETICDCQAIEHDIKLIYASMKKGNLDKNLDKLYDAKMTLGETIIELERLDNSDNNPYLSKKDYRLLKTITKKRNHIVHQTYNEFDYIQDSFERDKVFNEEYKKLKEFHDEVSYLWKDVQRVTKEIMERFGRI